MFKQYRRKQIAELRPYEPGEVLSDRVSISPADRDAGSPKAGDMIARNPKNHDDQSGRCCLLCGQFRACGRLVTLALGNLEGTSDR